MYPNERIQSSMVVHHTIFLLTGLAYYMGKFEAEEPTFGQALRAAGPGFTCIDMQASN